MALKLYGFPLSTCTRRVALIAKERNLPYELHVVDLLKGEQKQPGHLAHQPFGVVPYIDVRRFSSSSPSLSLRCLMRCHLLPTVDE
jgi:glutathione S-transferase